MGNGFEWNTISDDLRPPPVAHHRPLSEKLSVLSSLTHSQCSQTLHVFLSEFYLQSANMFLCASLMWKCSEIFKLFEMKTTFMWRLSLIDDVRIGKDIQDSSDLVFFVFSVKVVFFLFNMHACFMCQKNLKLVRPHMFVSTVYTCNHTDSDI